MVTATRRLSRELRRQHDRAMAASGHAAWETPDILPWGAWIRRCRDLGPGHPSGTPAVLSDSQLDLVWQDIIRDDVARHHDSDSPLWNIGTTARVATGTLRRMREWCIDSAGLPPSRHPDHAGFRRWLNAYDRVCAERGWIDGHALADRLDDTDLPPPGHPLVMAGFDTLTPQQQRLVERLAGRGGAVEVVPPRQGAFRDLPCHVLPTPEDQWRAAAAWALRRLDESPDSQVAIVVPDLGASREGLATALMDTLAPGQVAHPGASRDLPFHFSLGDSLASHPVARSLLSLLGMLSGGASTWSSRNPCCGRPGSRAITRNWPNAPARPWPSGSACPGSTRSVTCTGGSGSSAARACRVFSSGRWNGGTACRHGRRWGTGPPP